MYQHWLDYFPALQTLEESLKEELASTATQVALPEGAHAFQVTDSCENYLFLISGTVRVQYLAESGREIVLYRVARGETCVLTTACLLANQEYAVEGIAETEVEAILLPHSGFDKLLACSDLFRNFVFSNYATRLTNLMLLIEEVAFGRMDMRIARCLLDRIDSNNQVSLTHRELAVETGTAREVISRQLKEFSRRNWVRLERGRVNVIDIDALRRLADTR